MARYFRVPEAVLGGPEAIDNDFGLVAISRSPVRASAGPGAIRDDETTRPYMAVDPRWLKALTGAAAADLSIIRVEGDSMAPTLNDGDDILVDTSDREARLRDGIYVLRVEGSLLVKRLAVHPFGKRVTVQSDNPAYPDWPDCGLNKIDCVGRVIWAGRKVA